MRNNRKTLWFTVNGIVAVACLCLADYHYGGEDLGFTFVMIGYIFTFNFGRLLRGVR
jgi:hypothetical protein